MVHPRFLRMDRIGHKLFVLGKPDIVLQCIQIIIEK